MKDISLILFPKEVGRGEDSANSYFNDFYSCS